MAGIYKGSKKVADLLPDISQDTNGKFLSNDGTDTSWEEVVIPTKTSDLTNDSGFITGINSSDITTALGYTPYNSTNPSGYQTSTQVNNAISTATANMVETGDNISVLTNDSGYITNSALEGYATETYVNNHHDNTKQDVISDLTTIRSNASAGKSASDTIATYGDVVTHNTSEFATSAQGTKADTALQQSDIVNNTTSTATDKALSANAGKSLQDQLNNLLGRGKYLSIWDCTTGLAMDEPPVNPYTVETGSYFIVGKVGTTNYRPNGGTYDKDVPSTTVETNPVKVNDTYYYDGTVWRLLDTPVTDVAFSTLAGSPYDNTNLANALNSKVTGNNAITGSTHTKITYDSKGLVTGGTNLSASDIPNLTLSKISDITATASELNVLDGITASTQELNYVDGVTSNIQTQLNSKQNITDNTLTTTAKTIVGAINELDASIPDIEEYTANEVQTLWESI